MILIVYVAYNFCMLYHIILNSRDFTVTDLSLNVSEALMCFTFALQSLFHRSKSKSYLGSTFLKVIYDSSKTR